MVIYNLNQNIHPLGVSEDAIALELVAAQKRPFSLIALANYP